jgi:zinc D-Ala-D-Ala carboxypeptidase
MPIDLQQMLSPHFMLEEFVISQTAERRGIDNTPTDEIVGWLRRLCAQILEPARGALGPLRISSGYRCPALNAAVGGSKTSAHMSGYAADVQPLGASKHDFALWVRGNCVFDQIIMEFGASADDPAWVHVSCDPRARREILRATTAGYTPIQL